MKKIKLCPEIEEVFHGNYDENRRHFKPLASIDLSLIDDSKVGQVYVVYFNNDPYCDATNKYLNEYCDESKVTFDIIDGKYQFKAEFGYFLTNEDWKEWLIMGDKSYSNFKENMTSDELNPEEFIRNINGEPDWIQTDETPLNSIGQPMKFVCQMTSYDIVDDMCGEEIYLFYDSTDNRAVQVHQID